MKKRKRQARRIVPFRLGPELIDRLDRLAQRMETERPGATITRSEVVRMLLARGLDDEERRGLEQEASDA